MPVLDCTVSNCYYNQNSKCCLGEINVDGNTANEKYSTECGSFREKIKESFINRSDIGLRPEKKANIECQAEKCTYNSGLRCSAAHVKIQGYAAKSCTDTLCASFCK